MQEILLSQCVISELTKLLSLEGDTQIIKQTNRENEKKCFIFWSQNKQQKSERQTK